MDHRFRDEKVTGTRDDLPNFFRFSYGRNSTSSGTGAVSPGQIPSPTPFTVISSKTRRLKQDGRKLNSLFPYSYYFCVTPIAFSSTRCAGTDNDDVAVVLFILVPLKNYRADFIARFAAYLKIESISFIPSEQTQLIFLWFALVCVEENAPALALAIAFN